MFQKLYSIAANAFLETIRQPIYGVILITTALLLVLNVSLAAFTLGDDNKLLIDLGLSTLLLGGLFLSAFSAAGILSREIENKTVLSVISKPVGRPVFILGKFAGLLGALVLAYYLMFLVFVLTIRHGVLQNSSDPWDAPVLALGFGSLILALLGGAWCNYFYGKHFATTTIAVVAPLLTLSVLLIGKFNEHWEVIPFGSNYIGGQIIIAAYLVFLAVMLTAAVAITASTRFGQLMTFVVCVVFLALGFISDYAFGQYAGKSNLASIAYHVIPNIGPFWVIDGLTSGDSATTVTPGYVLLTTGYATLLTVGILGIAVSAFQQREVG